MKAGQAALQESRSQMSLIELELQKTSDALGEAQSRASELERLCCASDAELSVARDLLNEARSKEASSFDQMSQQHLSEVVRMQKLEANLRHQLEVSHSRCSTLEGQLVVLKETYDIEREAAASSAATLKFELNAASQAKIEDIKKSYEV